MKYMIDGPTGAQVQFDSGDGWFGPPLQFSQAEPLRKFFVKLTLPDRQGQTVFPEIEFAALDDRTAAFVESNIIPVKITLEDCDSLRAGTPVTKVIYLPNGASDHASMDDLGTLVNTRQDPDVDLVAKAKRLGTIVATVHLRYKTYPENSLARKVHEVIGGYDSDYWHVVDVPKLIKEQKVAFSPDKLTLALVRGKSLFVIESSTGEVAERTVLAEAKTTSVRWSGNEKLIVTEAGKDRTYPYLRRLIKLVNPSGTVPSYNGIVKANVGMGGLLYGGSTSSDYYWGGQRDRTDTIPLAGLLPGKHMLVLAPGSPTRNVVQLQMPTPKKLVEVQPRLMKAWKSTNLNFDISPLDGDKIKVVVSNNTDETIEISARDIRLETTPMNRPYGSNLWCLAPDWTDKSAAVALLKVAPKQTGSLQIDYEQWVQSGLWYDLRNTINMASGPVIPDAPVGKTAIRVWIRTHGTLPVFVNTVSPPMAQAAPDLAPIHVSDAGHGSLPAKELTDEQKLVRDFVLMKMKKGVLATGKIPMSSREHAIAVVSNDGANVPEVRTILLDELEKSFDDPNGNFVRQRLLRVARNLFELEGNDRWAYEYEVNGLNKSPSARFIPQNREALYAQSSMIETIIKLGYKANRSDIDDFVLTLCAAHHPQAKPFLLDVLRNPEPAPNSFGATDPEDNSDSGWGPKERVADG